MKKWRWWMFAGIATGPYLSSISSARLTFENYQSEDVEKNEAMKEKHLIMK